MQTIPTLTSIFDTITTSVDSTANNELSTPYHRYHPYNYFPTITPSSLSARLNRFNMNTNETYKSAFKPVQKRSTIPNIVSTTTTNIYPTESSYFKPPNPADSLHLRFNGGTAKQIEPIPNYSTVYNGLGSTPTIKVRKDIQNFDVTLKNADVQAQQSRYKTTLEQMLRDSNANENTQTAAVNSKKNYNGKKTKFFDTDIKLFHKVIIIIVRIHSLLLILLLHPSLLSHNELFR